MPCSRARRDKAQGQHPGTQGGVASKDTRVTDERAKNGRAGSQIASHVLASIGSGHFSSAASSASGCRTFGLPPQWATIEAKTGARSPYAGSSGPALPPTYSVGWNTMCGNSSAKNEQCCPVPEATSRQVFIGALPCEVQRRMACIAEAHWLWAPCYGRRRVQCASEPKATAPRQRAPRAGRWRVAGGAVWLRFLFSGSA